MKGRELGPHPNMKGLYHPYLLPVMLPLLLGLGSSFLILRCGTTPHLLSSSLCFPPILPAAALLPCWIPRYFSPLRCELAEEGVRRGARWKMEHTLPHARVVSVEILRGPLSRRPGTGSADICTAGCAGQLGGGPRNRRAEASLVRPPTFGELREEVLGRVRGRPPFGASGGAEGEPVRVRKLLERRR